MSRKRSLGRGLDALLAPSPPAPQEATPTSAHPTVLPMDRLQANRRQPRRRFDEAALAELAESILAKGLIQPIVVTPGPGERYTIVAGERRWRAARKAALTEVPVVVREVADDRDLLELALVENLQRSDLDPIEEAEAYLSLQDEFGLSQKEIGSRVGKSRPAVANALRLLNLPAEVLDMLRTGELTAGQARPLLAIENRQAQLELAHEALRKGLSARQLEARAASPAPPARKRKPTAPEVHAAAAAERLTQHLQTPVEIRRKRRGGEVRIRFHSEEELMRIYDLMMSRRAVEPESGPE
jgi:ParB family chromosome partitioning protein